MGHPLHPMLITLPIGLFVATFLFRSDPLASRNRTLGHKRTLVPVGRFDRYGFGCHR
jgi:hypothetical protein